MQVLPGGELPPAQPKPFWTLLDRDLSMEISRYVRKPFWIDTVAESDLMDVRVRHDDVTLRFIASRSRVSRVGSLTFVSWAVASSALFLSASLLLIRRPS
jgi:two-component system osmolarity sensor histidine kinase EnvZ